MTKNMKLPIDLSLYPSMPDAHRILVREYEYIISSTDDNKTRGYYTTILRFLLDGCSEYEAQMSAAKMTGYRMPAFKGDEMGVPADDEENWL